MTDKVVISKPKLISHSQMSKFENCPRDWHYNYVEKLSTFKGKALFFGNKVHSMLETRLDKTDNKVYTVEDFQYDKQSPEAAYKKATKLTDAGMSALHGLDELAFPGVESLGPENIEWEFEVLNMYRGFIDLWFINTRGEHIIVDWKTTSSKYSKHDIKTSPQLTAYAWAYKLTHGVMPTAVCFITLNKISHKASLYMGTRTKDDIDEYQDRVYKNYEKILLKEHTRKESGCNGPYGRCQFYGKCWGDIDPVIRESQDVMPLDSKKTVTVNDKDWF